jgi:hypothetical protein
MANETIESEGQAPATDLSGMLGDAGDRVREILQDADRTTNELLEETNVAAGRCLHDAYERSERLAGEQMEKLALVSEELLAQAAAIQQRIHQLNQVVEQGIATLASEVGIEEAPPPQRSPVPVPERVAPLGPPERESFHPAPPSKRGRIGRRKKQTRPRKTSMPAGPRTY